jgi:anthranilate synthase component 1
VPVLRLSGTPDLLSLHAADRQRYPYLLQTCSGGGWDILFAFPQEKMLVEQAADLQAGGNFFDAFDQAWQAGCRQGGGNDQEAAALPFLGGWFLYLGYELLHELEPTVPQEISQAGFPLACLTRIPAAVLVDNTHQQSYLVAEDAQYLSALQADVALAEPYRGRPVAVKDLEEEDEQIFLDGVERIKRYIREGDVFQVNLARRWQATLEENAGAADLYASLRANNPAPFSGIADFGGRQIVSSSPERLVEVRGDCVQTRPIAGTHPRSRVPSEDEQLRRQLISSPKERAEHIMLIDLERNDLGRICRPGSVEVDELMAVQTYAHVHHIESNVRGRLKEGVTPGQVVRALFPGGTITGCPKVRTMQIISELEPTPRFAYTGSMGYLNLDGSMDLNILIRSIMLDGNRLSFKAGAGIVADSEPARELAETRAKAKGLLKSLGVVK